MDKITYYEFKFYRAWCRMHNLKPSNPVSLKAYLKYIREEC